jgi:hypothetical protein
MCILQNAASCTASCDDAPLIDVHSTSRGQEKPKNSCACSSAMSTVSLRLTSTALSCRFHGFRYPSSCTCWYFPFATDSRTTVCESRALGRILGAGRVTTRRWAGASCIVALCFVLLAQCKASKYSRRPCRSSGFPPWRPGFEPRSRLVWLVDKASWGRFFRVLRFSTSTHCTYCSTLSITYHPGLVQ